MIRALLPLAFACLLSCEKPENEVVVTETRALTSRDTPPKLDATSDERFRDTKPSPVIGTPPASWLARPATQMRLLNYRFGDSGMGEVFVGLSGGGILANVNRWLNEFGNPPLKESDLSSLKSLPVAGTTGVLVTATGTYAPGRGQAPSDAYRLAGIVAQLGDSILTIKMVGPDREVIESSADLESFAASLKWRASGSVSNGAPEP